MMGAHVTLHVGFGGERLRATWLCTEERYSHSVNARSDWLERKCTYASLPYESWYACQVSSACSGVSLAEEYSG